MLKTFKIIMEFTTLFKRKRSTPNRFLHFGVRSEPWPSARERESERERARGKKKREVDSGREREREAEEEGERER